MSASILKSNSYSAKDIEVLEGLEPVRLRPGMYIGGTDIGALHHLGSEIFDNSMDEAVAGYATHITVELESGNFLRISDNGRGIPVDKHPKFRSKSALEVILTTLHSGGKFSNKSYATAGGLHGVGSGVVNALSDVMQATIKRDGFVWTQEFSRGKPTTSVVQGEPAGDEHGTTIRFHPDEQIFGDLKLDPARLYKMCRSKAYLFRGIIIDWICPPEMVDGKDTPASATLCFHGGLLDALKTDIHGAPLVIKDIWSGKVDFPQDSNGNNQGSVEWATAFLERGESSLDTYCNTIPTPLGGTHESGFRTALLKGIRSWGTARNNKKAELVIGEDLVSNMAAKLSVFITNPSFQGQTKEKLVTNEASKLVESAIKDQFDHFLASNPVQADNLLAFLIETAELRISRRDIKDVSRKSATKRLRLPGKLTDCSGNVDTELFLVEGDSAGGSAKQARDRATQAILPLRGKILNVGNASIEKMGQNQELKDLIEALGCGSGDKFNIDKMRYDRVIIMTDADVDGAHIATLLMTFFYKEMLGLIRAERLYLAQPPLYRLVQGAKSFYAMDDAEKDKIFKTAFKGSGKIEVSRFKGLGEMPPALLKETTMSPLKRSLIRVVALAEERADTNQRVDALMGKRPELRLKFINERGPSANIDI
jgi:topoisomerase-4 subunit B